MASIIRACAPARGRIHASFIPYRSPIPNVAEGANPRHCLQDVFQTERRILSTTISFAAASKEYQKGRYGQALSVLNKLLEVQRDGKTYALLARTMLKVGMKSDAAMVFDMAADQEDANATEYRRKAMMLHFEGGRDDEALVAAKRLFEKAPSDPDVAYVLATIFLKRGERDILEGIRKPLLASANPQHLVLASQLLTNELGNENDLVTTRKILEKIPGNNVVRSIYLQMARELNDYEAIARHEPIIMAAIESGNLGFLDHEGPWPNLHWCGDEGINRLATYKLPALPENATTLRRAMRHAWSDKIRIGYLSSDLWSDHATMKLLRSVLERHDRNKFDITLFCYTPSRLLQMNDAERSAWGGIVRVADMSDMEAASAIRESQVDILIDLKGHTKDGRPGILNHQAAPIQVAWLGFPGSTANIDLDYVIGDRHVLPDSSKPHYHEKFCRLPDTYQPNDSTNRPPLRPQGRADLALPQDRFLFASFNHNRKISPEVIELWARILKRSPESSLLLLAVSERSRENILKKFKSEKIAAERILFTPKMEYEQHLNRLQAADVGLDTFPVNGHTTTSEQLWGGLPVITVKGTNFASRVSESLLHAMNLPELVAEDKDAYVDLAVSCYENPESLAACRAKLQQNRLVAPLFDSERFRLHLEAAYEMMRDRARSGLDPDHFDVPALPVRTTPIQ